ncbi:MAG TPA: translation initiation factor IF-2, partial [Erysipelothrix sp.]|nr:translation initiation factor IF-2 [Erysipelothrix sp.]
IMGHVAHGKTTLLDSIRKTEVTAGEFGGITQHIGAYQIKVDGRPITFLDTPGHEAFTAMRARGAQITDIVIIVVAADDGVMPQTKEAIDHAKAADVPIIVAVNKIDKPTANPDRVMNELAEMNILSEAYGGQVPFIEVSALQGLGIEDLLETIILMSDLMELKANPKRNAFGTVIEARLDRGLGPVATILVQKGTLKLSDPLVIGHTFARVRRMVDDRGRDLKEAGPSMPVKIMGLSDVPEAGDLFRVFDEEKRARSIAEKRLQAKIEAERKRSSALSLEDLSQRIKEQGFQDIPIIIKSDVQGSAEAVKDALERIDVESIRINVIRATAGAISESDVMLASASNALIYGFNVRPNAQVRNKAQDEGVTIRLHNIIYKVVEEMEAAMKGMLAPVFEEVIWGQAEVREIFKVSRIGTIAGSYVTDGKIIRDSKVRLIRDGIVVYEGKLGSLRRFEKDVKEVSSGYECGITIENFNDIKERDLIESFGDQEVPVE